MGRGEGTTSNNNNEVHPIDKIRLHSPADDPVPSSTSQHHRLDRLRRPRLPIRLAGAVSIVRTPLTIVHVRYLFACVCHASKEVERDC